MKSQYHNVRVKFSFKYSFRPLRPTHASHTLRSIRVGQARVYITMPIALTAGACTMYALPAPMYGGKVTHWHCISTIEALNAATTPLRCILKR